MSILRHHQAILNRRSCRHAPASLLLLSRLLTPVVRVLHGFLFRCLRSLLGSLLPEVSYRIHIQRLEPCPGFLDDRGVDVTHLHRIVDKSVGTEIHGIHSTVLLFRLGYDGRLTGQRDLRKGILILYPARK